MSTSIISTRTRGSQGKKLKGAHGAAQVLPRGRVIMRDHMHAALTCVAAIAAGNNTWPGKRNLDAPAYKSFLQHCFFNSKACPNYGKISPRVMQEGDGRPPYKSQHSEDLVLLPLLLEITQTGPCAGCRRPGTFVELGALDGVLYSNTYGLEACFDWRGLLVEADAGNFAKLQASARVATRAHAAVCGPGEGTVPISTTPGQPWGSGDPTAMTEGRTRHFATHLAAKTTINLVPCKPLSTLMAAAGLRDGADFLSLDVEGAELMVLQHTNVTGLQVVLVEVDGFNPAKEAAIAKLLADSGFRLAYELVLGPQRAGGISHVFVQKSTSVPKLPDGTTASVGPLQYLEPASYPQRFVVDFCKRKWCWGCGMGECQERH